MNSLLTQCKLCLSQNFSLLPFFDPIQTTFVLSIFKQRPEALAYSFKIFKQFSRDFLDPSRMVEVSSAYCEIRTSAFPIFIPLIFSLFLIRAANISAQINKYGDNGSP